MATTIPIDQENRDLHDESDQHGYDPEEDHFPFFSWSACHRSTPRDQAGYSI